MNTETRQQKAQEALARQQVKELHKSFLFTLHKDAVDNTKTLCLPYRILFEIYKKSFIDRDESEIIPNKYYPQSGRLKTAPRYEVTDDDYKPLEVYERDGKRYLDLPELKQEVKEAVEQYEKQYRHWWLDDEYGRERHRYYFARFLINYDLSSFTTFDWFGVTDISQNEVKKFSDYFINLQQDCKEHPENYFLEPNPYLEEYYEQYEPCNYYPVTKSHS